METLKRIGNPFTQVLQKKGSPSPSYHPLGHEGNILPGRVRSCHSLFLTFSSIANAVMLMILLGLWVRGYVNGPRANGVCGLESDRLFGDSEQTSRISVFPSSYPLAYFLI
jgi:hypothetical protein